MAQVNNRVNARIVPNRAARFVEFSDTALNDSDKTITVPTGASGQPVVWEITSLYAKLITTASAGNRQVDCLVVDADGNEIGRFPAVAVQIASATEYYQYGLSGDFLETEATIHTMPFAPRYLPSGFGIRIYDSAAIAATADDLSIYGTALEHES